MKIIGCILCFLLAGCSISPKYYTPLDRMGVTQNAYRIGYYVDKRARHNARVSDDTIYESMMTNPLYVYSGINRNERDQVYYHTFGLWPHEDVRFNQLRFNVNRWDPALEGGDEQLTFETLSIIMGPDYLDDFDLQKAIFVHRLKNIDGAIFGLAYSNRHSEMGSPKNAINSIEKRLFRPADAKIYGPAYMFEDCSYIGYNKKTGFFDTNYRINNFAADIYKACKTPVGYKSIRIAVATSLQNFGGTTYMEFENSLWNSKSTGKMNRHTPGNDPDFPPEMVMKSFLGEEMIGREFQTFGAAYKNDEEKRLYFHYVSDGYESRRYITYEDLDRFFEKYQHYLDEFDRHSI